LLPSTSSVLAEHLRDGTGTEIGLHGFYVDVTPILQDGARRAATTTRRSARPSPRSAIDYLLLTAHLRLGSGAEVAS